MSVGAAISVVSQAFGFGGSGGDAQVTKDDLVPVLEDIAYRFSILADIMQEVQQSATSSVTVATDTSTQAEKIGQSVKNITNHTYTVVIPHSLSWLAGYIVSHFITPIQTRLDTDESSIRFLLGWRNQIDDWRKGFVDPNVELWVGFRQFFDSWPQSILFMWHDWLENPDHFAQWAAAPLIGPLVSYLAAPEHKQTRDNLTAIIAQAWAEDSNDIFDDVLTFLLSDT